ncbi:MAG: DUF29 domain-containing protein [Rhodospirillaceae bacterium]
MSLYDQDFYAWAIEQAALLRARNIDAADIDNIAEEIESMGRSEKRELVNRLVILLLHLLKWQYQPERRGASWRASIRNTRDQLSDHLKDNPSLKSSIPEAVVTAFRYACREATAETGLDEESFPVECLWSFNQIMDASFWPES